MVANHDQAIVIENELYAQDQKRQLERVTTVGSRQWTVDSGQWSVRRTEVGGDGQDLTGVIPIW